MSSQLKKQRQSKMQVAVGLLALAATATAQRVVPMSLSKAPSPAAAPTLGRRDAFARALDNGRNSYYVQAQVGTPPQQLTLYVDTGSSDLWVLSTLAELCQSAEMQAKYGECLETFDHEKSSTFELMEDTPFEIRYVDQTGAAGYYFTDNVSFGSGKDITRLQMGIAVNSTNPYGIMGIGYSAGVSAEDIYPNIIEVMAKQGLIASKAYSIYLNHIEAGSGTILFGGVDTEKFYGELKTVPVIPNSKGVYEEFLVSLTSLDLVSDSGNNKTTLSLPSTSSSSGNSKTSTASLNVHLDSGTSLMYFPPSIIKPLFGLLNAVDDNGDDGTGWVLADCALRTSDLHLAFQFGGPSGPAVNVSAADFIIDDIKAYLQREDFQAALPKNLPFSRDRICRVGIEVEKDTDRTDYLLGSMFLRSAYVVHDLENNFIGIAQSKPNATESKIVEIEKSGIPKVSGMPLPKPGEKNAGVGGVRRGLGVEVVGVAVLVGAFTLGLVGW